MVAFSREATFTHPTRTPLQLHLIGIDFCWAHPLQEALLTCAWWPHETPSKWSFLPNDVDLSQVKTVKLLPGGFNPFSQIGSFPQVGVKIKNVWVATTQLQYLCWKTAHNWELALPSLQGLVFLCHHGFQGRVVKKLWGWRVLKPYIWGPNKNTWWCSVWGRHGQSYQEKNKH